MRKMQENSGIGVMTSHNASPEADIKATLYQKCVKCADYGVSCNGPKLAALGDIMEVRKFHRLIRDCRDLHMKEIYEAAKPVAESTINDYFSNSVKDFKWTTVGAIDNALTAICGNRVGQPLLDRPCPATSSEILQQTQSNAAKLEEAQAECRRLEAELSQANQKRREQRAEIKAEYQQKIDHLKGQLERAEKTAERRYNLIVARDWIIIVLAIICMLLLALTVAYIVWDQAHPGSGLFW